MFSSRSANKFKYHLGGNCYMRLIQKPFQKEKRTGKFSKDLHSKKTCGPQKKKKVATDLHSSLIISLMLYPSSSLPLLISISICFDSVQRRRRHGSVTTRTPHQYWCVYDYEGTFKNLTTPSTRMQKKQHQLIENYQPQIHSKGSTRLLPTF